MAFNDFEHESHPQRVIFRVGGAREALAEEIAHLGLTRPLLVAAESEAELATRITEGQPIAATFDAVRPHVPIEVAEAARALATESGADGVISVGGGSTTGTAKAIAMTTGLPIIAVPTTYAGSEATAVWGLTEQSRKTTGTDPVVLPRSVIYDADLLATLPPELSTASGLNAMAHCVDSLWAPKANPLLSVLAGEGIRALAASLGSVDDDATNAQARSESLYGAYLSASAFAGAGSGLHHKICHVLGGAYDLPHAQTHAVILPHVLAFNGPAAPEASERIAAALGAKTHDAGAALDALVALYAALDAPRSLRELGMPEDRLDEATDLVLDVVPASNPQPVTREQLRALLQRAFDGTAPHLFDRSTDKTTAEADQSSQEGSDR